MGLENILIDLGAPILAKVIGQQFGPEAQGYAQIGIDTLSEVLGVEPTREAVETAVVAPTPAVAAQVAQAEAKMPDVLLAEAEKMRAGNQQQMQSNELLKAAMDKGPLWTWAWLYVWQYVLMFFWFWTLIGVYFGNAALRLAGTAGAMPAPSIVDLLTLTGLYLGLHMGGHTVLELMRGRSADAEKDVAQ